MTLASSVTALGAPCATEDYERTVSGIHECLVMRRFGYEPSTPPKTMLIWLHGDVSSGGPASYHFRIADKAAREFAKSAVISIALVRPGYPDGEGGTSSGDNFGRSDQYTDGNIREVGAAIQRLRERFKVERAIIVGHSGGAATAAVLLEMQPRLADATVLVACPCDLSAWRAGRRPWTRSEDPMRWAAKAAPPGKVVALTGSQDDNTSPKLAEAFIDAVKSRGIDGRFQLIDGATHNSAFSSADVMKVVGELINP